jgi:hypothetical protein
MGYLQEVDALQRWVWQTAGLKSHRLSAAPPQVARPVILWEGPNRTKGQNMGRYHYTRRTSQFGKLYVNNLDQLADLIDRLETDLANRDEWLPIYETDQAAAPQIGKLRSVQIDVSTTEVVDVPITIRYEVIYSRPEPAAAPNATYVGNKLKGGLLNG